jgi:glycosyltransferase involved in cell wall biosynthesis
MQISAVLIAKNEEVNLLKTLPKLKWCDEVIVVVDNQNDTSIPIAKSFGALVIQNTFETFGKQKQFAVNQAKNEWVLSIDADEVLSDELIIELQNLDLDSTNFKAFEIPRMHIFLNKKFKYGKESNDYIIRLFNKHFANFNDAKVHEKVVVNGKVSALKNNILHYSYKNLEHYFTKFNIYTTQGAIKLKEAGKRRNLFLCFMSFPFYFIKHYIFYLNFLNSWQGFVWSYLNACYHLVKYLKLHEINSSKK